MYDIGSGLYSNDRLEQYYKYFGRLPVDKIVESKDSIYFDLNKMIFIDKDHSNKDIK